MGFIKFRAGAARVSLGVIATRKSFNLLLNIKRRGSLGELLRATQPKASEAEQQGPTRQGVETGKRDLHHMRGNNSIIRRPAPGSLLFLKTDNSL